MGLFLSRVSSFVIEMLEMIKINKEYLSNRLFLLSSWIVAIVATGGSLYFSEIRHFTPCTLCWYQRILMYPLTISLGIAFFRKDFSIKKYILPVSILGFIMACYHYIIQNFPISYSFKTCTLSIPCTEQDFSIFGFITIPFMSGTAFFLITTSMLLMKASKRNPGPSEEKSSTGLSI